MKKRRDAITSAVETEEEGFELTMELRIGVGLYHLSSYLHFPSGNIAKAIIRCMLAQIIKI